MADEPWFCIAGLWRPAAANGADAFTLLTTMPGPDIAPYHDRQVVVLAPHQYDLWLNGPDPEAVLVPAPAEALHVAPANEA